jgi:sugar O-acyltransferase (sialic acid O-acetyltransferase NeuD family)
MTRIEPIVIVGAGGHGREVLDIIEAINVTGKTWEFLGFIDDGHPPIHLLSDRKVSLLGGNAALSGLDAKYVIGIGSPTVRRRLDAQCSDLGLEAASLIHPAATIGSRNSFRPGLVVAAHAAVTTNVRLGRHVHLNVGATVSHDVVAGDYVTLNPRANISGNVVLEDEVTIGVSASIIQGNRIGARTIVGAGAVVTRDLPPDVVAIGVPAREK